MADAESRSNRAPSSERAATPVTRPSRISKSSTAKPLTTSIDGVLATAAVSAAMMARPAWSPFTRTMRRAECAASRETERQPARSRSNGTP